MAAQLPFHPAPRNMVPPSDVAGYPSGQVPQSKLFTVEPTKTALLWLMAEKPARAMRALHAAAKAAGFTIGSTGRFRTYEQQVTLFLSRYTVIVLPGRPTKRWNGKLYYQLPNTAMAAAPPGTNPTTEGSPHGWGAADDTTYPSAGWKWLTENAESFGFAWSTTAIKDNNEDWHLQWYMGDTMPARVLAYEASVGVTGPIGMPPGPTGVPGIPNPPQPQPQPTPGDDDMSLTIFNCVDAAAVFIGMTAKAPIGGNALAIQVSWINTFERLEAFRKFGVQEVTVSAADLKTCDLSGPLPKGDPLKTWTKADFASVAVQA